MGWAAAAYWLGSGVSGCSRGATAGHTSASGTGFATRADGREVNRAVCDSEQDEVGPRGRAKYGIAQLLKRRPGVGQRTDLEGGYRIGHLDTVWVTRV